MNRFHCLFLITVALAAFTGYRLGKGGNDTAAADDPRQVEKLLPIPSAEEDRLSPEQIDAAMADLRHRFAEHISPGQDWILRHRTVEVLAAMSAADLERFAGALLPSLTGSEPLVEWQAELLREVYRAWAERDPAAACTGHAEVPSSYMVRSAAFNDWLRRDPSAVRSWLGNDSSAMNPAKEECWNWLLQNDAAVDFEHAAETVGKLDARIQERTILEWSFRLAPDRDGVKQLAELIAAQGNPEFAMTCYQRLVWTARTDSLRDSEEMLENAPLRDGDRRELLGKLYQAEAQRLTQLGDEEARRVRLSELYHSWKKTAPEGITTWLAAMPAEARARLESSGFGSDSGTPR